MHFLGESVMSEFGKSSAEPACSKDLIRSLHWNETVFCSIPSLEVPGDNSDQLQQSRSRLRLLSQESIFRRQG
jgi:hypothetical protein